MTNEVQQCLRQSKLDGPSFLCNNVVLLFLMFSFQITKLGILGFKPILFFARKNAQTKAWKAEIMVPTGLDMAPIKNVLENMKTAYEYLVPCKKALCVCVCVCVCTLFH